MISFGIQDGIVAPRTSALVYGTAVNVPHIQMMNVTARVQSAEGTGDDRIVVVASRLIAGSAQVRMQGVSLEVLEVVLGLTLIEIGSGDTLKTTLPLSAGHRLPWFGMAGQGLEEEGNGDVLIYAPKAKVASDISLGTLEYGTLSSIEFTATLLGEGDYDIIDLQHRATVGALAIPIGGMA
jgi:hypothetical protein